MSAATGQAWEVSLVTRLASGTQQDRAQALKELFDAYGETTHRLAYHLTGSSPDAEEVTQEVFLAAFTSLGRFRGEARLKTWLYRVTVRCAGRLRARRPPAASDSASLAELPAPSQVDPAIRAEQREALAQAMQSLSLAHRTVLALFALKGLSHQEISEILGIPEGTVWSRLHAARKKLALELTSRGLEP